MESLQARLETSRGKLLNGGSVFYKPSWFNPEKGGVGWSSEGDGGQIPPPPSPPPGQSTKVSFLLFPVSLPQTSSALTCDREKNTSFDSILQRLYLQKKKKKVKKKKKNLFPGRRQRVEYEPGKLLLIHAKLHSQHRTVFLSVIHPFFRLRRLHIHTHINVYTPTQPTFKEFDPSCSCTRSKETPSFWLKTESTSISGPKSWRLPFLRLLWEASFCCGKSSTMVDVHADVCLITAPLWCGAGFERLAICSHEHFGFVILENLTWKMVFAELHFSADVFFSLLIFCRNPSARFTWDML